MIIPLSVLLHLISVTGYMWIGNYEDGFWSTYYYASERIFVSMWAFLFAFKKEKTYIDKQFLLVWAGYNLLLGCVYVIKDYNLFPYIAVFKNVAIMAIYLFIATCVLTINIYRHGLYKN